MNRTSPTEANQPRKNKRPLPGTSQTTKDKSPSAAKLTIVPSDQPIKTDPSKTADSVSPNDHRQSSEAV